MILDINGGSMLFARTPDRIRGRVNGAFRFVNMGVRPVGAVIGGVLGGLFGVRETLLVVTIASLAGVLWLIGSPIPRDPRAARGTGVDGSLPRGCVVLAREPAQHGRQDAAVAVVVELDRAVDAADDVEGRRRPSSARATTCSRDRGVSPSATPRIVNDSRPVSPSVARFWPGRNCSGRMPMPTRLVRWMRSNDSAITARTPSSSGPFAAQSRDEPEPYSLPATTISGTPSFR